LRFGDVFPPGRREKLLIARQGEEKNLHWTEGQGARSIAGLRAIHRDDRLATRKYLTRSRSHSNWRKVIAVSQLHRKFNRCVPASKRRETRKSPAASPPRKLAGLERASEGKEQSRKKTNQLLAQTIRRQRRYRRPDSHRRHPRRSLLMSNLNIYIARSQQPKFPIEAGINHYRFVRTSDRPHAASCSVSSWLSLRSPIFLVSGDGKGRSRGIRGGNDNDMRSRNPPFLHFFPSRLSATAKGRVTSAVGGPARGPARRITRFRNHTGQGNMHPRSLSRTAK